MASGNGDLEVDVFIKKTFLGANHPDEIESLKELREWAASHEAGADGKISLSGCTLQQVDLRGLDKKESDKLNWAGSVLWACTFPSHLSKANLESESASVFDQPTGYPFLPMRAFMYRCSEMQEVDKSIYEWHMSIHSKKIQSQLMQTLHDFSIKDALYDYLEGKSVAVVMGGHATSRGSREYKATARLGYQLARAGFIVATGGGPGSMEAANLGAYMSSRSEADLEKSLELMSAPKPKECLHEYLDHAPPLSVIAEFGLPVFQPSLGIPTWLYGHEPPSMFPTWQAKMFSNAIREDGLIDIGNAGIIYVPGGAGTRQEVFQAACKNHYADQGEEIPMLFWGKDFWESSGIFHALEKNSRGRPMHNWLRLTDSVEDIVTAMKDYATKTHLPLVSIADLEQEHTEVYAHALKEKVRCEKDRKRKREEIASRNRTAHRRRSQDVPLALLALL